MTTRIHLSPKEVTVLLRQLSMRMMHVLDRTAENNHGPLKKGHIEAFQNVGELLSQGEHLQNALKTFDTPVGISKWVSDVLELLESTDGSN